MIVGGIKVKFSDQDVTTRLGFVNLSTEKISQRMVRCNVDYEKELGDVSYRNIDQVNPYLIDWYSGYASVTGLEIDGFVVDLIGVIAFVSTMVKGKEIV